MRDAPLPYPAMAYLYFIFICLFFGTNFILMDRASGWFSPLEIGFGRVIGASVVLGLLWYFREPKKRLRQGTLRDILICGLIGNSYPYVAQPMLIGMGFGHSFFGMTIAFTPLLTILVSLPLLGIKPTMRQLIGVLFGLGFAVLLLWDGNDRGIYIPLLLVATTVPLCYALGNTWLRRTLHDQPSIPLTTVMLMLASISLLPIFASPAAQKFLALEPPTTRENFWASLGALVALSFLGTGACIGMFVRLIQMRGPLFAGMVTYVVPVLAMLWGQVDGEIITGRQIFAIAGILTMVAMVQTPSKKQKPTTDDPVSLENPNPA